MSNTVILVMVIWGLCVVGVGVAVWRAPDEPEENRDRQTIDHQAEVNRAFDEIRDRLRWEAEQGERAEIEDAKRRHPSTGNGEW